MAFKFSFFDSESNPSKPVLDNDVDKPLSPLQEDPAKEIFIPKTKKTIEKSYARLTLNDVVVQYYQQTDNTDQTDLVPGVYEGGKKTWECSYVLADYLADHLCTSMDGLKVLEMGCGSALPALYCLCRGATVHFQDYNDDVIRTVTIPNVRLTVGEKTGMLERCRFFSGDWRHFDEMMARENMRYDLMLLSETLYNMGSYEKQYNIFLSLLSPGGSILVASKSHYFGVGGGVESFREFVKIRGEFNIETLLTTEDSFARLTISKGED